MAHCGPPLTMHLGPEDILLNLDVQFRGELSGEEIMESVDRLERGIRSKYEESGGSSSSRSVCGRHNGHPTRVAGRTAAGHAGDDARPFGLPGGL